MAKGRAIGFGIENLPRIVRGEGSYLIDDAGRRYLDGSGGPAAFCIGHANREVNAAIAAQLDHVACGYRYLFTSDALEQLTQLLLSLSGPQFGHVVYTSSGSESMESALKVALQYFDARGLPAKRRFISRHRSYHGNTLGALSVSGYAERRAPFEGSLLDVSFVSAANAYRPPTGFPKRIWRSISPTSWSPRFRPWARTQSQPLFSSRSWVRPAASFRRRPGMPRRSKKFAGATMSCSLPMK